MVAGGVGRINLWFIPRLPAVPAWRAGRTELAKGCYEAGRGASQHIEPCVERVRLGGGVVAGCDRHARARDHVRAVCVVHWWLQCERRVWSVQLVAAGNQGDWRYGAVVFAEFGACGSDARVEPGQPELRACRGALVVACARHCVRPYCSSQVCAGELAAEWLHRSIVGVRVE
eukprot:2970473-Prymnesium_polylepis.1